MAGTCRLSVDGLTLVTMASRLAMSRSISSISRCCALLRPASWHFSRCTWRRAAALSFVAGRLAARLAAMSLLSRTFCSQSPSWIVRVQ